MEENGITMADMIVQMIDSGQLSYEEEMKIRKKIEEKRKDRCLADVIESEVAEKMDSESIKIKTICQSVHKKCFKESKVGTMNPFKLTDKMIRKFEKDVREFYGLNEKEMVAFMGMFQMGLNKMAEEGILDFTPDRNMFKSYLNSKHSISYINNPYSAEDTERIEKWVKLHPIDVKGMAIHIWLLKGISFIEIVNLTKKDCWDGVRTYDSIMKFDEDLFEANARSQIVWSSLRMHPKEVRYVFAVPRKDGSGWERLTVQGLQKKLWHICRSMNIDYKSIHGNEAIKLS